MFQDIYTSLQSYEYTKHDMFGIDHFNYCANVNHNILDKDDLQMINDLEDVDCGHYDKEMSS